MLTAGAELTAQEPWLEDAEFADAVSCQKRFAWEEGITRALQGSSSIPIVKRSSLLSSAKDSRDASLILFSLSWLIPFSK